ncbi:uncharacterized protein NEMAJ01_1312, partial [Nematocida major]
EILAQMKPLEGKALNKAIQTILKTTHKIEQLRSRLQMVTGWADESGAESDVEAVMNSILYAHGHTVYTGKEGALLEFAYTLATEAEHANVKSAGRLVLEHLPLAEEELARAVLEKLAGFFPDTENLLPGQEDRMEQHISLFAGTRQSKEKLRIYVSVRAEAILVLAKRCKRLEGAWKMVLGLYKKIDAESAPMEKVRALGLAVLRTLKGESELGDACSQYVQSMRMGMHDFVYGQILLGALQALEQSERTVHEIEKLAIYALTESRATVHSLEGLGIARLPRERVLSILGKIRAEKINVTSSTPVIKQILRAMKHSRKDLAVVAEHIERVLAVRKHKGLGDVLKHVRESLGKERPEQGVEEQASLEKTL